MPSLNLTFHRLIRFVPVSCVQILAQPIYDICLWLKNFSPIASPPFITWRSISHSWRHSEPRCAKIESWDSSGALRMTTINLTAVSFENFCGRTLSEGTAATSPLARRESPSAKIFACVRVWSHNYDFYTLSSTDNRIAILVVWRWFAICCHTTCARGFFDCEKFWAWLFLKDHFNCRPFSNCYF